MQSPLEHPRAKQLIATIQRASAPHAPWVWLLAAAACAAGTAHVKAGTFDMRGFLLVLAAGGCIALWALKVKFPMHPSMVLLPWAAVELLLAASHPIYVGAYGAIASAACVMAAGAVALLIAAMRGNRSAGVAYRLLVVGGALAVGIFTIAKTAPGIDVWTYDTEAARRILHGQSLNGVPYFEPTQWMSANYPYMPFEALLRTPFLLLGDVRYASLAAVVVTYPIMFAATKRMMPNLNADLVATVIMLAGGAMNIVQNSWTEPLIIPFLAGAVLVHQKSPLAAYILLGLASATKLWLIVLLPAAWSVNRLGGVVAAAAAFATAIPFLAQDPMSLLQGTVIFHLHSPVRVDGDTLAHFIHGWPVVTGMALWAMAGGWLIVRKHSLGDAIAMVVVALLAFFMLGKQGNPNYYWFIAPAIAVAAAAVNMDDEPTQLPSATATEAPVIVKGESA